uniref:Putative secreted protein n=1 Tax=Anopheles marajoara TaxID=58244 RepID=A0A2M4CED6_9DIPT
MRFPKVRAVVAPVFFWGGIFTHVVKTTNTPPRYHLELEVLRLSARFGSRCSNQQQTPLQTAAKQRWRRWV